MPPLPAAFWRRSYLHRTPSGCKADCKHRCGFRGPEHSTEPIFFGHFRRLDTVLHTPTRTNPQAVRVLTYLGQKVKGGTKACAGVGYVS